MTIDGGMICPRVPEACRQFGRIPVAQHGGQGQQPHGDDGGADNTGRGGEKGAHHHNRDGQASRQGAEDAGHGGEQVLGDPRALQGNAHENEHGDGQEQLDGGAGKHPFVHPVDDECQDAEEGAIDTVLEDGNGQRRQVGVTEKGDRVFLHARADQRRVVVAAVVDDLLDEQSGLAQAGDDGKGDKGGPADGEGHGIPRQDPGKQAHQGDEEPDFDAVKSEHHTPASALSAGFSGARSGSVSRSL